LRELDDVPRELHEHQERLDRVQKELRERVDQ
jgi:hypothetical protein